jgi:hypothetical protein
MNKNLYPYAKFLKLRYIHRTKIVGETKYRSKMFDVQSAKYEFASSNITRTTFAFDACFVWKLAPLADERNGIFHRIFIATIDAIEHVFNVANSYLACRVPRMSLHRVIPLERRLRLTRVLYGNKRL